LRSGCRRLFHPAGQVSGEQETNRRDGRPWYFSALVFCWFATLATGFEFSREYLLWLIGRLGIVAIWFGAISFFLLYVNTFRQKRGLERNMKEAESELKALGLEYVKPVEDAEGSLRSVTPDAPFDPYDPRHFT
jgi:hypothetical protein